MTRSNRYDARKPRQKALKTYLLRHAYYRHLQKNKRVSNQHQQLSPIRQIVSFCSTILDRVKSAPMPSLGKRKRGRPKKIATLLGELTLVQFVGELIGSSVMTIRRHGLRFLVLCAIQIMLFTGVSSLYTHVFKDLPQATALSQDQPPLTTKILSRDGDVLYKLYAEENRTFLPLSEIPAHVIYATIAIEDQDFYHHHGFSIRGISRAVAANLKGESLQGGSTLTQQLVKIRLLTPERTITRKLKELLLSILVEQEYSKDQILEMYFNQVAYGGSAYGIEEAAQKYFGKSARDLTLAEGAMLAGLPAAPSVYNPFGPNPELASHRQEEVLRRMAEEGFISAEDAQRAREQKLAFSENATAIQAPHFVMYVRQLLAEKYGEEVLTRGGLEIRTSLDLNLQNQVQDIVSTEIQKLNRLNITNGASMVTNPKTGEILAMVGSVNYFDFEHDGQVNVALRPRQPGSSIKPLTYALGMEQGLSPASIIEDTPVTFPAIGGPPYSPKNYDNRFHGRVTVREALASSYNIPAVKTLNSVGVTQMIDKGEQMGITTWEDRSRFGLSLTLGGGEITMADMTLLYGAFANGGYKVPHNPILEVTDSHGKVLYHNDCALDHIGCEFESVLSPGIAFLITNILSDNTARTPAFGPQSVLHIPNQEVAVKTGTTNNLKDNWTFGYTSDYVTAVWVGNNNGEPMSYVASGITGASPIWNEIMQVLLDAQRPHVFAQPPSVVKTATCISAPTTECPNCVRVKEEYFLSDNQPTSTCSRRVGDATQSEQESVPARVRSINSTATTADQTSIAF